VLVTKLLALTEQQPDFQAVLALARALREQIDWDYVRERSSESAFAQAFFVLVEGLGIVDSKGPAGTSAPGGGDSRITAVAQE
jgi:hypothetical protein